MQDILGRTFRVRRACGMLSTNTNHLWMAHSVCVQSFNDIFKSYEAKTGKGLEVTYKSAPELQAALTSNPHNLEASYILPSPLE